MILKVYIFFGFCVYSVNSAINITTENRESPRIFLHNKGIVIRDSDSIYFKVKSCEETFMDLVDGSFSFGTVKGYPLYQVHFGRRYIYLIDNPFESVPDIDNTSSPTYYCDHYIPFWVSWIDGTIEAGEGTCIGYDKFDSMPRILNTFTDVTDISIMSYTTADWLFDIPKNTTSDCTPGESTVGSGSGPTIIRTSETTTPEFGSTTISSTIRTTPELASTASSTNTTTLEFASTTISSNDTTTQEFASTTKSSTNTTTPEFASTTISSTDTTTPEFATTTKSSTNTTISEFASTTISSTDTTTPEFGSTTINSTYTTTPEFESTTKSSTATTTPEFATTTKSSTGTSPEFASTTISSTDTTTPEFGSTTINSTYTTTLEFESTTKSSTATTTPEFATTTKSSTGTSPEFASTTISSTDTTPEFDPTTISTISSTATTASSRTTYRSSTKSPCTCSCNNFILTEDELIRKIALLKSELSVDRKQTNKYKRSLISASDNRPSSKYIGTFGIVVLVVICTLIVLMDLQHCACFMFYKKK